MSGFWSRGVISALVSLGVGLFVGLVRGPLAVSLLDAMCLGLCGWFCVDSLRGWVARTRWRWLGHGTSPGPAPDGTFPTWPGWAWVIACMVLGSALSGVGALALSRSLALQLGLAPDASTWQALPGHGLAGLAAAGLSTLGVALAISLFVHARERVSMSLREAADARRLAAESQLRLLQAQLEPHMLFNTLANLRVLIGRDPPQAQAMLDHLIAFLRATLGASRRAAHPLSDEFERLADYLSLMQVRMGARLRIHLDLPDELRACAVPPLLIQPLVENALLHGLAPKVEGGDLWVQAWSEGDGDRSRLCVRVRDSGVGLAPGHAPGQSESPGTGFGVRQVRERLAATWGQAASFSLHPLAAGGTEAVLAWPLDDRSLPS